MALTLPAEFADLQPFAPKWAMATEYERIKARRSASAAELRSFYDKMTARIAAILQALDAYPVGKIPATHRPLMHLALALAEIAPNVEFYRLNPQVPHAFDEDRFLSAHGNTPD